LVGAQYTGAKSAGALEEIAIQITRNGTKIATSDGRDHTHSASIAGAAAAFVIAPLAAADVIRMQWKTSGGTINVSDRFLFVIRLGA
jgi:hypothetical protein